MQSIDNEDAYASPSDAVACDAATGKWKVDDRFGDAIVAMCKRSES